MKKTAICLVIGIAVVLLVGNASGLAFELSGDMWLTETVEGAAEVGRVYTGKLSLFQLGPLSLQSELQFAGETENLEDLLKLIRKEFADQDLTALESEIYLVADVVNRVAVDWPLNDKVAVLGSVGYRLSGYLFQDSVAGGSYGLYQGLTYAGGLGLSLLPGLRLQAVYEIAPRFSRSYPEDDSDKGNWRGWDVGLRYRFPFIMAKAGLRYQQLKGIEDYSHGFSGAYLGAGILF